MLISRRDFLRTSAVMAGTLLASEGAGSEAARAQGALNARVPLGRAVRFEIHPSLGIARVGNSADAFYFGPEVPGVLPHAPAGFKDQMGAMAKQAARFRIYAIGPHGEVLGEVPPDVRVDWTVSVANKKAAWYESSVAMDISVATPVNRRNPAINGSARDGLVGAASKSVSGRGASPVGLAGGTVFENQVDFGEIFTDGAGRLLVLPGDGRAYPQPGAVITTFADNDGWTDNICDGVVEATVHVGGRRVSARSAYLLVTPPNYGPAIGQGAPSLLDQVRSPLTEAGLLAPTAVRFQADILSLLQRLVDMQWVNKGIFGLTRPGQEMDWLEPRRLARLADRSAASRPYRSKVAGLFRNPAYQSSSVEQLPLVLGDGTRTPPTNQYSWLPVTTLQYLQLQAWARGDFEPGEPAPAQTSLSRLPLADQPGSLDEASLASVLGGANHPGVEAPWVLRVPSMWDSAYHLRILSPSVEMRDYGDQLTPAVTLGPGGPVHGVTPGDLTMWMGVPWHADAASCRSGYRAPGYDPPVSPYLPTFWPARVPNEVLTERDYRIVVDTSRPLVVRQEAFARRRTWLRPLAPLPTVIQQLTAFVTIWPQLGVVTPQRGPADGRFPATIKVETDVTYAEPTALPVTVYPCASSPGVVCPIDW